jgi:predicted Co/Zn/Cd cation transporter (cation efflux family)
MVTTSTVEQRMNEFEVVSVTIVIVFTLVLVFGCFALWFVVNRKSERVALVDPEGVAALEASEHQR